MSGRQILEDNSIINTANVFYRKELFDYTNIATKYSDYTALSNSIQLYAVSTAVTTAEETLRDNTETVSIMTGSNTLTLISTSTADTTAGTGGRSVYLVGLDANRDQISETINLTGTVSASSTVIFSRINRAVVFTAGGDTAPTGTIYIGQGAIVAGKPTTINGVIMPGVGWMRQGIMSTPRNYMPIITEIMTSAGKGKEVLFKIMGKFENSAWIETFTFNNYQQPFIYSLKIPAPYYEKVDIQLKTQADQAGTTCLAIVTFQLIHISLL
jgi:hypothetical protein